MSAPRPAFAAVLVAAAWTTAIGGIAAVGPAKAEAAWLASGPGTAGARALQLVVPDLPVATAKCNSSGQTNPSVTLQWTYPGSTPPGFGISSAATQGAAATMIATAVTSPITISLDKNAKTMWLSVRAVAGTWLGPRSGEVKVC
ncbi:hypothetical protein [Amycolatopsis sp. cmx-4-68]|uniref:hypothetical protein n=1 Tax=Amycolatopsis sp. cmx-4-68 TaxID=2790938 RepID=UPI00397AFCC7